MVLYGRDFEACLAEDFVGTLNLLDVMTGDSATSHIHRFIMQRAQQLLMSGATISETAESLGFDYPQHFTRQFKKHFGITPSDFIRK